jgi:hypothetical protein
MYSYLPYEIFSSSASVQLVRTLTKYRLGPGLYNFDLVFRKGTCFARIQEFFSLKAPRYLDQLRDHTSPSGLEASAKARAVIRVEVLMEKDVILPLRIGLRFFPYPRKLAGDWICLARRCLSGDRRFRELPRTSFPEPVGHSILKLCPTHFHPGYRPRELFPTGAR